MYVLTGSCVGISADPSSPVYAGEMQIFALGMNVEVADSVTGEDITDVSSRHLNQLAAVQEEGSLLYRAAKQVN